MKGKGIHKITFLLLIIGGLNWLLLGLFQWEIGALFGGSAAIISRVIYVLVGLAAIYEIATHKQNCKECGDKMGGAPKAPSMPPSSPGGNMQ